MASDRGFRSFYVLTPDRGSIHDTEFSKSEPINRGDAPTCPACGRFLGMRRWLSPRHAQVVVHGESAGDFAFASSSEFIVSDKVVEAIAAEGLAGLDGVEEVEIASTLRSATVEPRRYFFAEVSRQGGDVDERRSDIERTVATDCGECLGDGIAAIRGFALREASWAGADVFVPRGLPGVVVVSETFRRVADERGFTNAELVPTERFTWLPSAV